MKTLLAKHKLAFDSNCVGNLILFLMDMGIGLVQLCFGLSTHNLAYAWSGFGFAMAGIVFFFSLVQAMQTSWLRKENDRTFDELLEKLKFEVEMYHRYAETYKDAAENVGLTPLPSPDERDGA